MLTALDALPHRRLVPRSELAPIDVSPVSKADEGVVTRIRRSKTESDDNVLRMERKPLEHSSQLQINEPSGAG